MERPERLVLHYETFFSAGLRASAVCVQVNKGIEFGLPRRDAAQMRIDDFHGRDFFIADACRDFRDPSKGEEVGHKKKARVCVEWEAGQARSGAKV